MENSAKANKRPLTIALLAGETSGDNLGAPLIRELKQRYPGARFVGIGGPLMIAEGLQCWFSMDSLSINGFLEPIKRLPALLKLFLKLRKKLLADPPDCFVGIDFNFFNLLLEGRLKRKGVKTVHYVSPTVWAWRRWRIKSIARNVDLMLTLYPFETAIYEQNGILAKFVGHPKAREIDPGDALSQKIACREKLGLPADAEVMAILPGSRSSEVKLSGPDFFAAAKLIKAARPECKFVVAAVNNDRHSQIAAIWSEYYQDIDVTIVTGQSREVMSAADLVLVNSGTATLEALLLRKPMVMSYRLGKLTYAIVSRLVKTQYFALPNILADKLLVPELLQDAATPEALAAACLGLFDNQDNLVVEYATIHEQLNLDSSAIAADALLELITVENEGVIKLVDNHV